MKKLLALTVCLFSSAICTLANADDAKLQIKVSGASKNNTYFLCLDGSGCVSMFAADHGKTYPLSSGSVDRIFMVNRTNLRTYFQPIPASCNVTVNPNQTLTVHGKVVQDANSAHIENMKCDVV